MEDYKEVTRLEVIDHVPCSDCNGSGASPDEEKIFCRKCQGLGVKGRQQIFWDENVEMQVSMQDNGKTMKIFVKQRENEEV